MCLSIQCNAAVSHYFFLQTYNKVLLSQVPSEARENKLQSLHIHSCAACRKVEYQYYMAINLQENHG